MIDLGARHLDTIRSLLAQHVPDCEVRAFGSRVNGRPKPYSDLDLALVGPERLPLEKLSGLREAFAESDLPIRVDVLDWHAISESFRAIITEKYEVISFVTPPVAHSKTERKIVD